MAEYKVLGLDNKTTKTGKNYYKARLEDENGHVTADVAIWPDFPEFSTMTAGDLINGELTQGTYGWSLKSNDRQTRTFDKLTNRGGGGKTAAVNAAMERKEQSIYNAQENKEQAIRVASTASGATAIVSALIEADKVSDWKKEWIKTRAWLYENWNNTSAYPSDVVPEDPNAPF